MMQSSIVKFFSFSLKQDQSIYKLAKNLLLISLVFHLAAAWFNIGYYHPDEYFQISEFASSKMGKTPVSDLPWEYQSSLRPAFQPAMMYCMSKALQISNPVMISFVMRLLSALAAWLVTALFILISLSQVRSVELRKLILWLSTISWFLPFLHARFSSENWSSIFFLSGLSILLILLNREEKKEKMNEVLLPLFISGIAFGLAYVVRFQTGFMIAGVGCWLLFYRRLDFKNLLVLFSGIAVSVAGGILVDRWFYGKWVLTAVNYFNVNILEGKTADWGVAPWWDYFRMIFINTIPPFSIVIMACVVIFFFRHQKHILSWICIPFLIVHIINGHKELRFLFPLVNFLPVVIGLSFDGDVRQPWLKRLANIFSNGKNKIFLKIYIGLNVLLMFIVCIKPANESFSFYDFMYSNYHDREVNLYTASGNPYELVGLPVDFFKPGKLKVISIPNDSLFIQPVSDHQVVNLFLEKDFESGNKTFLATNHAEIIYQNIPEWMKYFNFNDWLKRSKVWRVYRIGEAPPQ
jgi:phosphatidylinositol glycan class B